MKILAIHNFHRNGSASGDDQVFKSETALLEDHGHEIVRYTVSNDEFDNTGVIGKLTKKSKSWLKQRNRILYIFILFSHYFHHRFCMRQKEAE